MLLVDTLMSFAATVLDSMLRRFGYSVVETAEIDALRRAQMSVEDELVLCALSGPMKDTYLRLPGPIEETYLLPRRFRSSRPKAPFTVDAPWDVYWRCFEQQILEPPHSFCATVLPRQIAEGNGFTLSETPAPPRRYAPSMGAVR